MVNAKEAKQTVQMVRKTLKYLLDEGYATATYNDEHPNDLLHAIIKMKSRAEIQAEVDSI